MFKGKLNVVNNVIKSHPLTLESAVLFIHHFQQYLSKARSVPGNMFVLGIEYRQNREKACYHGA